MEGKTWLVLLSIGTCLWSRAMYTGACGLVDHEGHEMPSLNGFSSGGFKCRGAKCECPLTELKTRFYQTVGHVVANCRINKAYREKYPQTSTEVATEQFELHDEACEMMQVIGQKYKNGDFDDEVNSCCDYKERTITFQCLHTYLTLHELKMIDGEQDGSPAEKDNLAEDLEAKKAERCDNLFKSPRLLVEGIKNFLGANNGDNDLTTEAPNQSGNIGDLDKTGDWSQGGKLQNGGNQDKLGDTGKQTDTTEKPGKTKEGKLPKNGKNRKEGRKGRKGDRLGAFRWPSLSQDPGDNEAGAANDGFVQNGGQNKKSLDTHGLLGPFSWEDFALAEDSESLKKQILSILESLNEN